MEPDIDIGVFNLLICFVLGVYTLQSGIHRERSQDTDKAPLSLTERVAVVLVLTLQGKEEAKRKEEQIKNSRIFQSSNRIFIRVSLLFLLIFFIQLLLTIFI